LRDALIGSHDAENAPAAGGSALATFYLGVVYLTPDAMTSTRARIEQAVGKHKRFKRVALRCEKTAASYSEPVSE